ncbi:MAG: rRNA maturation RNase YbeY [Synergistaceae bacterium]|nr:rRNA maturation RNase YbeY [Synergistaceae bacterium]
MKLSICINTPEDSSGADDADSSSTTIPNHPEIHQIITESESIAQILESYLAELYPDSKLYEAAEISLSFMSPEDIRELNRTYRDVNEATDVLSFPLLDEEPIDIPELPVLSLGDIVICPEETARLHPELSLHEAMCLMIAHSFLHLLGYDHDNEETQAEMWALQDEITAKILGRVSA